MKAIAQIEARVSGIPCLIAVHHYQRPTYNRNAPSDLDYYGFSEWSVLDQRGRDAAWLARKLTEKDVDAIEEQIRNYFEG